MVDDVKLPRVLIDANRQAVLEIVRGRLYAHAISPLQHPVSIVRISLNKDSGFKLLGDDAGSVIRFCKVWLNSFRPKTARAERILKEILMNTIDVKTATTAELVAFHNKHSSKPVKKFSDRATAEKRCEAVLQSLSNTATVSSITNPDSSADPNAVTPNKEQAMKTKTSKSKKPAKPATTSKAKPEKKASPAKAKAESRAEAVSASWGNKKVAAARAAKHNVKVGGVVYRSVLDAFQKLKLDVKKHGAFRLELKAKGRAVFEGHTFTLVPKEKE